MRMNELAARILGWANDRNLIEGSTVEKQNVKLVEEFGEFAAGLARGKVDVQADALGDMMVILIIMGQQTGVSLPSQFGASCGLEIVDYDDFTKTITDGFSRDGINRMFLLQSATVGEISIGLRNGTEIAEYMAFAFANCLTLCLELQMAPAHALEDVWNIIKDRKGKMVDGVFVKENDAMMAGGGNQQ